MMWLLFTVPFMILAVAIATLPLFVVMVRGRAERTSTSSYVAPVAAVTTSSPIEDAQPVAA